MGTHYDQKETKHFKKLLEQEGHITCYVKLCTNPKEDKYKNKLYLRYPESKDHYAQETIYNPPWSYGWNYGDRKKTELNLEDDYFKWHNRTYSDNGKSWLTGKGIHVELRQRSENIKYLPVKCYAKDFVATSKQPNEYRGGSATFAKVYVFEKDWKQYVQQMKGGKIKNKKIKQKQFPKPQTIKPKESTMPSMIEEITTNKTSLLTGIIIGLASNMILTNPQVKKYIQSKIIDKNVLNDLITQAIPKLLPDFNNTSTNDQENKTE